MARQGGVLVPMPDRWNRYRPLWPMWWSGGGGGGGGGHGGGEEHFLQNREKLTDPGHVLGQYIVVGNPMTNTDNIEVPLEKMHDGNGGEGKKLRQMCIAMVGVVDQNKILGWIVDCGQSGGIDDHGHSPMVPNSLENVILPVSC